MDGAAGSRGFGDSACALCRLLGGGGGFSLYKRRRHLLPGFQPCCYCLLSSPSHPPGLMPFFFFFKNGYFIGISGENKSRSISLTHPLCTQVIHLGSPICRCLLTPCSAGGSVPGSKCAAMNKEGRSPSQQGCPPLW